MPPRLARHLDHNIVGLGPGVTREAREALQARRAGGQDLHLGARRRAQRSDALPQLLLLAEADLRGDVRARDRQRARLPAAALRELHARYHAQGLEIVNISVDQAAARPALEKLVARLELPWPQAFDGKGPRTEYAVRYGVGPIPHVLLAGRDGMIAAVNPRGERLETEIRRLLGLKP